MEIYAIIGFSWAQEVGLYATHIPFVCDNKRMLHETKLFDYLSTAAKHSLEITTSGSVKFPHHILITACFEFKIANIGESCRQIKGEFQAHLTNQFIVANTSGMGPLAQVDTEQRH